MKEIISSLDIGSDSIKLVIGEYFKNNVNVLGSFCVQSKGVKKGIIVEPEETLSALKELFKKAESSLNTTISKVILVIPSYYAEFISVEGKTTITNEEGKVLEKDIVRTMQACVYNKIPSNKEMVSIIPKYFVIDEKDKTNDPLNKKANVLECYGILSLVPKKNVYTAFSVLDALKIEIVDICLGGQADYSEFENDSIKDKLGCVINIGSEKTEVSIINKGVLIDTECLEIGSINIDKDICYTYDIKRKDAVKLKETFALANKKNSSTSWNEDMLTKEGKNIKINQYEISNVVSSRIKEILELAHKQINLLTNKEISYIIVVGGISSSSDFNLMIEEVFGKVTTYNVSEMGLRNNKYSSVIGNIKYYHNKLDFRNKIASTMSVEEQSEIVNIKNKENNILEKIHGYFWNS